jgi:dihydroflavonol-4-reductase
VIRVPRTAFVTGGTGFVGLNLVQLLMAQGWDVTALHRASSDLKYLARFAPRLAQGSITDAESLLRGIAAGTDTVFHVAGNTNMWRKGNAEQTRDNVDGTRNVVEAALAKGVRRLVVTSSISAYGLGLRRDRRADAEPGGHLSGQLPSNQVARPGNCARRVSRGLEVVILQPGAIIGPFDLGTWSRCILMVRDGKLPGVPPAHMTFAHVREVVAAHLAAADRGENGGQYLLGGENRSMLEFVREIAKLLGKRRPARKRRLGLDSRCRDDR